MADEEKTLTECNTRKQYGCCPLAFKCNKPLTDECYQRCILPEPEEAESEKEQ